VIHLTPLALKWSCHLPEPVIAKMTSTLATWERTPYADGSSQVPGSGVSCLGFICVVLDALYGRAGAPIFDLPADVGLTDPAVSKAAMRWFLERYSVERVGGLEIQPGDILVVSNGEAGTPDHLMLVGPRKNTLWHSTECVGVHYTGLALVAPANLHSIYRCTDRDLWLPN
jgi:cell wall-associated NlpC family hydrolase